MYRVATTGKFRRDYQRAHKRGYDLDLIEAAIAQLAKDGTLPEKYRDHALTGRWKGKRECHIVPDWLLVYEIKKDILVLILSRTGTHADIFKK